MNTARMLNDYDLFRGIDAEQMRTLLPCLNARIIDRREGYKLLTITLNVLKLYFTANKDMQF